MTLLKFLLADAVIDLLIIAICYRFFMGALAERIIALREVPKANLQAEDYEDTDDSVWEEGWVPVLIVFVLLCIVPTVHAQVGGSVGQAPVSSTFQVSGHTESANYQHLAAERDLLIPSSYISVQGDGTMMVLPHPLPPRPLGDLARENKVSPLPYTGGKFVQTVTP